MTLDIFTLHLLHLCEFVIVHECIIKNASIASFGFRVVKVEQRAHVVGRVPFNNNACIASLGSRGVEVEQTARAV